MPSGPRILVAGAGVAGGEVLQQLGSLGHKPRALVRNLQRADAFRQMGVELIEGDFASHDDWRRALAEIDRVFLITTFHQDAVRWHAGFLEVAKVLRVERIVQLSGMSDASTSPAVLHRRMSECDEALRRAGLAYTILQPNTFYQNLLGAAHSIRTHGRFGSSVGSARISMIDVRDVAGVAVKALLEDEHAGKAFVLTGPDVLTFTDVASRLSEVLGRPIYYDALDPEETVRQLIERGLSEQAARDRVGIQLSFSSGAFSRVTDEVRKLLGEEPRSFVQFALDHSDRFR